MNGGQILPKIWRTVLEVLRENYLVEADTPTQIGVRGIVTHLDDWLQRRTKI
jgi:hypothetical protein